LLFLCHLPQIFETRRDGMSDRINCVHNADYWSDRQVACNRAVENVDLVATNNVLGAIANSTESPFMSRKPPTIPTELQAELGEVEYAFGPNVRVRVVAILCGLILAGMGALFVVMSIAGAPLTGRSETKLMAFFLVAGVAIIVGSRMLPMDWVFVGNRGLVRKRGSAWDGIAWSDVDRFEDASLTHKGIAIRQCRIVLNDGSEWGFISENFAEYGRLKEILKEKSAAKRV